MKKKFIENIEDWEVSVSFGTHSNWRKDVEKYIKNAPKMINAIKHNIKIAKSILKKTDKKLEDEKFWDIDN